MIDIIKSDVANLGAVTLNIFPVYQDGILDPNKSTATATTQPTSLDLSYLSYHRSTVFAVDTNGFLVEGTEFIEDEEGNYIGFTASEIVSMSLGDWLFFLNFADPKKEAAYQEAWKQFSDNINCFNKLFPGISLMAS